ncbi:hypothetical protein E3N88_12356 [Mikania micrantha]|uniref:Transcription repressor n=1 Tax=Mikania micrantha TaxID=192012 RepID=A0A5N6P6K6_9ASTR|nr:hypothetical protein E3N88_12356 [Mikania micrantha]
MVKFKLRIFKYCQTKHTSTPPDHSSSPCDQLQKPITGDSPCTTSPPPPSKQTPHRSSFKSHISSTFHRCSRRKKGFCPRVVTLSVGGEKLTRLLHVDVNDSNERDGVVSDNKNSRIRPKNVTISSARYSSSYTVGDNREDEERPEIFSKSFSDVGIRSRRGGTGDNQVSPEWGSPARLSVFKKLMPCKVEGKVKESFAVVKRSEKPYEDFKKSMMEMIVENQIYEEGDLKQLLQCFLSLNSRYHHGVIMEAFLEIWKNMLIS